MIYRATPAAMAKKRNSRKNIKKPIFNTKLILLKQKMRNSQTVHSFQFFCSCFLFGKAITHPFHNYLCASLLRWKINKKEVIDIDKKNGYFRSWKHCVGGDGIGGGSYRNIDLICTIIDPKDLKKKIPTLSTPWVRFFWKSIPMIFLRNAFVSMMVSSTHDFNSAYKILQKAKAVNK